MANSDSTKYAADQSRESYADDAKARRVLSVDESGIPIGAAQVEILVVDDTGTVTYLGYADSGTATAAASWRILRVTNASGNIVWADGDGDYDNIWDNRAALSYS